MKVAILSIPHTGTHFVFDLFGGKSIVRPGVESVTDSGTKIICKHINFPAVFEEMSSKDYVICTPMRDPLVTLRSWYQWQYKYIMKPQDITELREKRKAAGDCGIDLELPYFEACEAIKPERVLMHFKALIQMDDIYDINYFPVDSINRQSFLDEFNRKYGTSLKTKWKPRNTIGAHEQEVPVKEQQKLKEFLKDNKEFFEDKFGYKC
jgi:hypothetical protein